MRWSEIPCLVYLPLVPKEEVVEILPSSSRVRQWLGHNTDPELRCLILCNYQVFLRYFRLFANRQKYFVAACTSHKARVSPAYAFQFAFRGTISHRCGPYGPQKPVIKVVIFTPISRVK